MSKEPQQTADACLRCGQPLWTFGEQEFRVGGSKGGWKMVVGEWAELGEDMVPLEMLACRSCGKVELRVPDAGK